MAKILVGWEFGAGLGHLTRVLPIVEGLREAGHRCVVAVSQLAAARGLLQRFPANGSDVLLVQAPFWTAPAASRNRSTDSLADALQLFGYGEPSQLSIVARAWRGLLAEVKPDLVVGDFAPTLNLAVGNTRPVVTLGNGYTVPPPGRRLPPIRPWRQDLPPASVAAEDDIMRAVNAARAELGFREVGFLSDLFSGTESFVCTIRALDPYAAYRTQSYLRPFNYTPMAQRQPVDRRPPGSVFLYLPTNHGLLNVALEAIAACDVHCLAYVPNLPAAIGKRFGSARIRFAGGPQPLGTILPAVRVVVHHGGLSTAYQALRAATPQLVLPHQLEHLVTGFGLHRLRVAAVFPDNRKPDAATLAEGLGRLLVNRPVRQAAEAAADALEEEEADPAARVIEACLRLL